jgi:hypothetical protein
LITEDKRPDGPPPPPMGVRIDWEDAPSAVREAIEDGLGSKVVHAETQPTGFSPGLAARLRLADGRRVFAKAVGTELNPKSAAYHRREAQIVSALPASAPAPRLQFVFDQGEAGWVALVFDDVAGRHPANPWQRVDLTRVLDAMVALSDSLTPSPLALGPEREASEAFTTTICGWRRLVADCPELLHKLDPWSLRNIDALVAAEGGAGDAVVGDTLLHFDIRADNILLMTDRVWFVDWPHVRVGAAWVDALLFAPSVTMQGGPDPEAVASMHPAYVTADPAAVSAAVVAFAGYLVYYSLQPAPPGLPTLRAFQAAQGEIARQWIADRTGWT